MKKKNGWAVCMRQVNTQQSIMGVDPTFTDTNSRITYCNLLSKATFMLLTLFFICQTFPSYFFVIWWQLFVLTEFFNAHGAFVNWPFFCNLVQYVATATAQWVVPFCYVMTNSPVCVMTVQTHRPWMFVIKSNNVFVRIYSYSSISVRLQEIKTPPGL